MELRKKDIFPLKNSRSRRLNSCPGIHSSSLESGVCSNFFVLCEFFSSSFSVIMSSPGKFQTVREVKKRSKKSRTLPVRLKLLNRVGGGKSLTPPPKLQSSNLSIFRNASGEPWSFDIDAYGIYMDLSSPDRCVVESSREDLSSNLRSQSAMGYEDLRRVNRSKSLTRADAQRKHYNVQMGNPVGCGSVRSRSRTRSRSRLQNMNASFTQCFGFGGSPMDNDDDEEPEDISEIDSEDFESQEFINAGFYDNSRRQNVRRKLSFDEEDQYYPSGWNC